MNHPIALRSSTYLAGVESSPPPWLFSRTDRLQVKDAHHLGAAPLATTTKIKGCERLTLGFKLTDLIKWGH
ncbi:hypothetical protein [Roseateles amylovorans]|uniref:Uncharacterized protein n=1 Tax=Roseateles amylovorans TaxID=2978473 RepID=A0ABY6B2Q3_9BURK|nr:hypothetical protein [Roseateles amylovorans]UXH79361.1 hypothetical protein N4261_05365 [Roseateles amylovorans]